MRLLADEDRAGGSDESRSELLAIFESVDDYSWVLRDPLTHQAAQVEAVISPPNDEPVAGFRRIQEMAGREGDPPFPISIAYARFNEVSVTRVGPWVEEYHLCPLLGVMVDGSDFAAPWPISTAM